MKINKAMTQGRNKTIKQNNKAHILFRYGLISLLLLMFSAAIIIKMFNTTIVEASEWNKRMQKEMSKVDTIQPERGSILASNGNILACNLKIYDIRMDLRHPKILKLLNDDAKIDKATIDSLADSLDYYYPRIQNLLALHPDTIAKYSWHKRFEDEFSKPVNKRSRALRLAGKKTLDDFNRIRNFPLFKTIEGSGREIPIYHEGRDIRMYPYGDMARLSIGRVYDKSGENSREKGKKTLRKEIRGYAGLEKALDSLLYGKPGLYKKVALNNGISNWVAKPAQKGYDILTTIDIDIQDMLEEELLTMCDSINAEWGTAIIMEVATGEIKAISNIEFENGKWTEAMNRAVMGYEPGSVMKPISLMIAFEDGLVKSANDVVECSPFQRTSDHGPRIKTMKQVIEQSSNTGISRVIFRGYKDDPAKFHDRLASIGFFEPMHSGIGGEQIPNIRKLLPQDSKGRNITMTARHLDLARQAYGYNTEIPPLYTLSYYNAIANKGHYMRPHLVRALIDENGRDSVIPDAFVRNVCSEKTASMVKECIREVVWGKSGTARRLQDDRVEIAGKTGTAYPYDHEVLKDYDMSKRRYAFAGFFPYNNPKYSCIVLILGPSAHSAGRTSGEVLKNIAIKMYSRGMLDNHSNFDDKKENSTPTMYGSADNHQCSSVAKELNLRQTKKIGNSKTDKTGVVPNAVGLDSRSAIKIMEQAGMNVKIQGEGYVITQSIPAGTPLKKGENITLKLTL